MRCARARRRGPRPSTAASPSSAASRGCCSATARCPCCPSRSSRRSPGCSACRALSRRCPPRSRGSRGSSPRAMAAARRDGARRGRRRCSGASARLSTNQLVSSGRPLRVGIVQGNVPQDDKWQPALGAADISNAIVRLTTADDRAGRALRALARVGDAVLLRCAGARDRGAADARADERARRCWSAATYGRRARPARRRSIYNAAFMLQADGTTAASIARCTSCRSASTCRCKSVLFFAAPLVEAVSDFSPGARVEHAAAR